MSRLGSFRERPPINPLDALLDPDAARSLRPKVLIVAAHLCDIAAAAGGHVRRWNIVGVVHAIEGLECADALREWADVSGEAFISLGYSPQDGPAHLLILTTDVAEIVHRLEPQLIVTQAYEGGDCDQDAVAFAVHKAAAVLGELPLMVEMTGWHAVKGMRSLGEFVHRPGVCERMSRLTPEEEAGKAKLLESIPEVRDHMIESAMHVEHFRVAPHYDFTRPPHSGPILYESTGGRWTGESWRMEAARVLPQLQSQTE